jgi:TorA maturation chaperone TorD
MGINELDPAKVSWAEILTGELLLFGLLGKILYMYPEESWLQPLFEDAIFAEAPFAGEHPDVIAGSALLETLAEQYQRDTNGTISDLKVDYTRLFDHTDRIPVAPWESVYLNTDNLLFQEQTLGVRSWYNAYGLEITNKYKEPDDHIGLELAFLAHLANLSLNTLKEGDESKFEEMLSAQRRFLSAHPLRWIPTWCNLVEKHAHTDFYRGVALILRGALMKIAEVLDLEIPKGLVE